MQQVLSAIGSERRREILRLVWDAERSAGEIAAAFDDVSWPAISQHLGVLRDAGLVQQRRDGNRRLYLADKTTLGPMAAVLDQMWRDDLSRLKDLAEAEARGEHAHDDQEQA